MNKNEKIQIQTEPSREVHFHRLNGSIVNLDDTVTKLESLVTELDSGEAQTPLEDVSRSPESFTSVYHEAPDSINALSTRISQCVTTLREMLI